MEDSFEEIPIGKARRLKDGKDLAILSFGHPGNFAASAIRDLRTEGLNPAHYDMRFVKPLDESILHEVFKKFDKIITVEDGCINGGFGSAILEFMSAHQYQAEVRILGIPDSIIEQGTPKELQAEAGFDAQSIARADRDLMKEKMAAQIKV